MFPQQVINNPYGWPPTSQYRNSMFASLFPGPAYYQHLSYIPVPIPMLPSPIPSPVSPYQLGYQGVFPSFSQAYPIGIPRLVRDELPRNRDEEDKKNLPITEKEKDLSLEELHETSLSKKLFKGSSYKNRNVYKSILRNLEAYVKNNNSDICQILTQNGYTTEEMEHAFAKIRSYNTDERKRGYSKQSQSLIKKMLMKKTIYTYILRETLFAMKQNSEKGKLGRIDEKSYDLYFEVSTILYNEAVRILGKPTEGHTYKL